MSHSGHGFPRRSARWRARRWPRSASSQRRLWQTAWGRGRLVGRSKAEAAWVVVFLQPLIFVFLRLRITGPLDDATLGLEAIVPLATIGVCVALALRAAPYRGVEWTGIAALTLIPMVAFGLAIGAERFYVNPALAKANRIMEAMPPPLPAQMYPSRNIVCAGTITRACAREAASREEITVAWARIPSNPRLALVVYPSAIQVFESLRLARTSVTLTSGAESVSYETPVGRTVKDHGETANVRIEHWGAVSFDWTHARHHFQMMVLWSQGGVGKPRLAWAIDLWRSVRYAMPKPAA